MAYHNKIRPNLSSEVPNFFSGLASHQLCRGIETQLPQAGDALVEYLHEVIFHFFLLAVLVDPGALLLPEVALAGASVRMEDDFMEILNEGVARLRKLGFEPTAKLVSGQPAEEIGNFARQIEADLIVVGHRRQSAFDRWWSGPKGAYLMDYTDCSLLVARNVVSDETIEAMLLPSDQTND